jgi:hypothetical protein
MAIIAGEYGRVLVSHDGDNRGMCVQIAIDAQDTSPKRKPDPVVDCGGPAGHHSVRVHAFGNGR